MANDLGELIKEFLQLIYLIIIFYICYQVLNAILGGTWATENIIIAGMGIILAGLFVIVGFLIHQAVIIGKLDERTHGFEKRIDKLEKKKNY
ncbi:MAG: hypothetical protein KJ566_03390 [Nanoarchaeota archaeon]|nr:hypothetical protein [Nanoarchaeota archaeon]